MNDNSFISQHIGIFGGRFNPIHYAHLILAQTAQETLALDQVLFVPSGGQACYKEEQWVASGEDRLAMIQLAIQDHPCFQVSDYEIQQGEFSYTIDTLRHLRDTEYPKAKITLLVGGDWSNTIPTWKEGDQLLKEFPVAVFSRPGFEQQPLQPPVGTTCGIQYIEMPLLDISSSMIRTRIRNHQSIHFFTPDAVCRYIAEKGLY